MRLGKSFYEQQTKEVARQLLGKIFVRRLPDGTEVRGIVVEVEAYLASRDPASHSYRGRGKKNASMFLQPGTLYVYPIHSRYCLNIVTEPSGIGAAVLVRALEPLSGVHSMRDLRKLNEELLVTRNLKRLTQGPGRLCEAMGVDRALDGINLCTSQSCWLEAWPAAGEDVKWTSRRTARIGISQAKTLKLRWFIDGNHFVSGCAREHTAGRHWSFISW